MKVKVTNPNLSEEERTYLTADWSSGTTLTVANNNGFTASWYVVVGEPGQEKTETQQIASTSGNTTITVSSALKFAHSKSTPVYLSQWNKFGFERKASGGSYAAISSSPLDIGWDNADKKTMVVVTSGVSTDTYRWRFYNSALTTYADYGDELAGTGLVRTSVGHLIKEVQKNPVAKNIDSQIIMTYFNDYQMDVVYPELPKAWWFTKEGTAVSTAASDYDYSITDNWSDFRGMKFLRYNYINGDTDITYILTWSPTSEFYDLKSDANQGDDDNVSRWTLLPPDSDSAKGYIGLHTTPATADCYLNPVYYFELSDLNSFGDTVVIPYPKGYIDYALYRIFDDIKSDAGNANKYNARVARGITYLKRLNRQQLGQPELFRFRGTRGWSRMFGSGGRLNSSEARELYW